VEKEVSVDDINRTIAAGPFAPSWDSLTGYRVPAWYEDGKFGIFIHWGVYAVPAFGNEWYPRNMYQQGTPEFEHHVATYGSQAEFGYKDFIPRLTAERYDPAAWARLFKEAGARFVVPVAEHHDGFAMYDCSFSDWTAVKLGPRRDLIGDLARAVRYAGLVFDVSYHRVKNWFFFDGGRRFPSDV
jgi:alpha-L-fucosidase